MHRYETQRVTLQGLRIYKIRVITVLSHLALLATIASSTTLFRHAGPLDALLGGAKEVPADSPSHFARGACAECANDSDNLGCSRYAERAVLGKVDRGQHDHSASRHTRDRTTSIQPSGAGRSANALFVLTRSRPVALATYRA